MRLFEILAALFAAFLWPFHLLCHLVTPFDPADEAMAVAERVRAEADAIDEQPVHKPNEVRPAAIMRAFLNGEAPMASLESLPPRTRCWLLSAKAQELAQAALDLDDEDLVAHATGRVRGLLDEAAVQRVWTAVFSPKAPGRPAPARARRVDRDDWPDVEPAPAFGS